MRDNPGASGGRKPYVRKATITKAPAKSKGQTGTLKQGPTRPAAVTKAKAVKRPVGRMESANVYMPPGAYDPKTKGLKKTAPKRKAR